MRTHRLDTVVHHLRGLALPSLAAEGDGTLLERFLAVRDEAAFEELLCRHGPMVLGICRRVAGEDAEDAFQATFLVLVHKADSVRPRGAVGNWLHGVAVRTSLDARARRQRLRQREGRAMDTDTPAPEPDDGARELLPLLDREIARLPEAQREAVVLCELEGRPRAEAARMLDIPEGTLSSRLADVRKRLARRLGASAGAALALAATAAMPAPLAAAVMNSLAPAALIPPAVNALLQGALMSMLMKKVQALTVAVLAFALLAGAVGLGGRGQAVAQPPGETKKDGKKDDKTPAIKADEKDKDKAKEKPAVKEKPAAKPSAFLESLKKHEDEIARIRKAMLDEVAAEEKKADAVVKKARDDMAEAAKKRDGAAMKKASEASTQAQREKSRLWRLRIDIETRIRMGVPVPPRPLETRLGVSLRSPSSTLRAQLALTRDKGLVVASVTASSAAAKAGLKANDILLELGGKAVPGDTSAFRKAFGEAKLEDADVAVIRAGKPLTLKGLSLPDK